jgi:hypothetical protein
MGLYKDEARYTLQLTKWNRRELDVVYVHDRF